MNQHDGGRTTDRVHGEIGATEGWVRVLVGFGSNVGDRSANLEQAIELTGKHPEVKWRKLSSWRETEPVGGPPQGRYLNGAGELVTRLGPEVLLALFLRVEDQLGRERAERWGPRTIDLDILTYGGRVLDGPDLTIPHPRLCERGFVLEPVVEVAPEAIHPVTGKTFRYHWLEWLESRPRGRGASSGQIRTDVQSGDGPCE